MIEGVLLDLYDTVADGAWGDMTGEIIARTGVDRAALYRALDRTRPARSIGAFGGPEGDLAAIFEAAGVETDADVIAELTVLELERLPTRAQLYDDALPVVRELRARGVRTALISNCSHSTRPLIDAFGLEDEFDAVLLSFEVGAAKPDAVIFKEALSRLGSRPERTVFVDDQPHYADGAVALGIRSYVIARKGAAPMEGARPDGGGHEVVSDLRHLLALT